MQKAIGPCTRCHHSVEVGKFPDHVEANVPPGLKIHIFMDNYWTHKTKLKRNGIARIVRRPSQTVSALAPGCARAACLGAAPCPGRGPAGIEPVRPVRSGRCPRRDPSGRVRTVTGPLAGSPSDGG